MLKSPWFDGAEEARDLVVCVPFFQLLQLVERLETFPVTAPIIRFLTGMELLLEKAQVSQYAMPQPWLNGLRGEQIKARYRENR